MKKLTYALGLMLPFSMAEAGGLDIRVGDEAVAAKIHSADPDPGPATELGVVYNSDAEATVGTAGLFVTGSRGLVRGKVGAKAYAVDLDNQDGYGVALGADLKLPLEGGFAIQGGLYIGPDSLGAGDVDTYTEWYISASFEIIENASIAAGISSLEIETDFGQEVEVEDGFFLEMKLEF